MEAPLLPSTIQKDYLMSHPKYRCLFVFFLIGVLIGCGHETDGDKQVKEIAGSMSSYITGVPIEPLTPTPEPTQTATPIPSLGEFTVMHNSLLYKKENPESEDDRADGYTLLAGQMAHVLTVSSDGEWLLVHHPVIVSGWLETDRVDISKRELKSLLDTLPVIAKSVTSTATPFPSGLSSIAPRVTPSVTVEQPVQVVQNDEAIIPHEQNVVKLIAVNDAAIFVHANPGSSPDERTGYFVPIGQTVYAIGLAEDRYWVHIMYDNSDVEGWVSSGYFTVVYGDMGVLPTSDYFVGQEDSETETGNTWKLPSRPVRP